MQYTLSIPGTAPNPTKKKRKAGARRKPGSRKAPSKPRAKSRKRRVAPTGAAAAPAPKRRRRRRVATPTTAKKPARRRRSQAARPKARRRRGRLRNPIPGLNFQFSEIATFGAGVAVLEYGMRNLVGPRFSTGPVGAVVKAALGFGLGELLKRLRLVSPSIARSVQAAGIAVGVTELVKVGLERIPNILNKPLFDEMLEAVEAPNLAVPAWPGLHSRGLSSRPWLKQARTHSFADFATTSVTQGAARTWASQWSSIKPCRQF